MALLKAIKQGVSASIQEKKEEINRKLLFKFDSNFISALLGFQIDSKLLSPIIVETFINPLMINIKLFSNL